MRTARLSFLVLLCTPAVAGAQARRSTTAAQPLYWPERYEWQTRTPESLGFDAAKLNEAIAYASAHEATAPRETRIAIANEISGEPFNDITGPVKDRGPVNGVVIRRGYIAAEWGDTRRVDMTFSVTKTYLSTVAGLAFDDARIASVTDRVYDYVQDSIFASPKNSTITWHQLLNQTSDWSGVLWEKPDWADRPEGEKGRYQERVQYEPGTRWKYNDVRVNVLAYALLNVWRRPLPEVLRERIMDPIGASSTWRWYGYRNSWTVIDGLQMQSVGGGGHWGGGLWISSRDHARFGLMMLRDGRWKDRQLISREWIRRARTPTPVSTGYGYMNWFLNTERKRIPDASESAVVFMGSGMDSGHFVYVDQENDLVIVVRCLQVREMPAFIGKVLGALKKTE